MTATLDEATGVRVHRISDADVGRTLATLVVLFGTLPFDLALVLVALLAGRRPSRGRLPAQARRTILLNGGKMTKALQLARSFHLAGHRVILVESEKYRWTGHRFSRAVDAFYCVPEPTEPGYALALLDIVRYENVDVYVPVSSPAGSVPDAVARELLDGACDVVHSDAKTVQLLDDKAEFASTAASLSLRVPDSHRITDARQVVDFAFPAGRSYILKRIAYDPVGRMNLTRLSGATPDRNAAYARSLPISEDDPWILQEFIEGREYCTHGTARSGRLQVYGCCESSSAQVNYRNVDKPEIRRWVETFVKNLNLSGQVSFDFIEARDGQVYAIECNPRTHSAITMFHDHPDLAAAYLDDNHPLITPNDGARPTYWIYQELWRLLRHRGRISRLVTMLRGKDAIFAGWDPMPYLMVHHLQIPALLWANLRAGKGWSRIDFNIGKLVENGGD
ncbi:ATP-grasp domain-containing protein [Mycobacterium sp. TY815]|uniref:ATP-grasp domain-containing protein n=1 Tax=Mycobacterium sp. TY815 TaxID=3050581 RepID=UPI0027428901|nr:ATP-grasp domain-containing protein [Mycobacterium sp. TY815]MDP7705099.1 ATP-grasp domain-containing protein [Mycobacterium sp. TY815]